MVARLRPHGGDAVGTTSTVRGHDRDGEGGSGGVVDGERGDEGVVDHRDRRA